MDYIIIAIGFTTLIVALITEIYARKTYQNQKNPKIVLEAPFNNSLHIRNVGIDVAKKHKRNN